MIQNNRTLGSKRVVVTRAVSQAGEFAQELECRGAVVHLCPCIEVLPPISWDECDTALRAWPEVSWIVFTSVNAVEFFLSRLQQHNLAAQPWRGKSVAAVGPATAAVLARAGVPVNYVPSVHTGADLGRELVARFPVPDNPVFVPRSDKGRDELVETLTAAGWPVHSLPVYRTVAGAPPPEALVGLGSAQAVTFASPSAVAGFAMGAGADFFQRHPAVAAVSIGPTTSSALDRLQPAICLEASSHTIAGMIRVMEDYFTL